MRPFEGSHALVWLLFGRREKYCPNGGMAFPHYHARGQRRRLWPLPAILRKNLLAGKGKGPRFAQGRVDLELQGLLEHGAAEDDAGVTRNRRSHEYPVGAPDHLETSRQSGGR